VPARAATSRQLVAGARAGACRASLAVERAGPSRLLLRAPHSVSVRVGAEFCTPYNPRPRHALYLKPCVPEARLSFSSSLRVPPRRLAMLRLCVGVAAVMSCGCVSVGAPKQKRLSRGSTKAAGEIACLQTSTRDIIPHRAFSCLWCAKAKTLIAREHQSWWRDCSSADFDSTQHTAQGFLFYLPLARQSKTTLIARERQSCWRDCSSSDFDSRHHTAQGFYLPCCATFWTTSSPRTSAQMTIDSVPVLCGVWARWCVDPDAP